MIVRINKSFDKDIERIRDQSLLNKIAECIEKIQVTNSLKEIQGIKKLVGYDNQYRIKIDNFRLGLFIDNNEVEFVRCLHRKDIYRYFPK